MRREIPYLQAVMYYSVCYINNTIILMTFFLKFSDKISKRFPQISKQFRRFPKITEDYHHTTSKYFLACVTDETKPRCGLVSSVMHSKYFLRDYVTMAMVIFLVTMATSISVKRER